MRQQIEADTESGDGQHAADGPLCQAGAAAGEDTGAQTKPVFAVEGSVFLGVAHHARELPLELIHELPFTPPAR